jgi:hypothetical protein
MMKMPKYWNSKYYDRETNVLSKDAPEELKAEWDTYNAPLEFSESEDYIVY